LEIIPTVTHDSDHVAEQDANDDEDQGHVMGDAMKTLQLEELEEIHVRLNGSL